MLFSIFFKIRVAVVLFSLVCFTFSCTCISTDAFCFPHLTLGSVNCSCTSFQCTENLQSRRFLSLLLAIVRITRIFSSVHNTFPSRFLEVSLACVFGRLPKEAIKSKSMISPFLLGICKRRIWEYSTRSSKSRRRDR